MAHQVARADAGKLDAIPQSAVNEVFLQIPTTAHILAAAGRRLPRRRVIDKDHQVFGYPGSTSATAR